MIKATDLLRENHMPNINDSAVFMLGLSILELNRSGHCSLEIDDITPVKRKAILKIFRDHGYGAEIRGNELTIRI